MIELKRLRGKSVTLTGDSVENDIRTLYPALFPYTNVEQVYFKFPSQTQIKLIGSDYVECDFYTLDANIIFELSGISISNVIIKSATSQTGYIFTAGI